MEKEREPVRRHVDVAGGLLQINPFTKRYKHSELPGLVLDPEFGLDPYFVPRASLFSGFSHATKAP